MAKKSQMNSLVQLFDSLIEYFVTWLYALTRPVETYNDVIEKARRQEDSSIEDRKIYSRAVRIWLAIIVIGLFLQIPIYQYIVSGRGSILLTATFFLFLFLSFVLIGIVIHYSLTYKSINSAFGKTYLMLVVLVGRIIPFWAVMQYPKITAIADWVKSQTSGNQSQETTKIISKFIENEIWISLGFYDRLDAEFIKSINPGIFVIRPFIDILLFSSIWMFANLVGEVYEGEKDKTFSAVALSTAIFGLIETLFYAFIAYMFYLTNLNS